MGGTGNSTAVLTGLHPSLCVGVSDFHGIVIPGYDDTPPRPLTLGALRLLIAAAAGDSATVTTVDDDPALTDFVHYLLDTNLADTGTRSNAAFGPRPLPDRSAGIEAMDPDLELVLESPIVLAPTASGFWWEDSTGEHHITLSPEELVVAAEFRLPRTITAVLDQLVEAGLDDEIDTATPGITSTLERLRSVGLIKTFSAENSRHGEEERRRKDIRSTLRRRAAVYREFDERTEAFVEAEAHDPRNRTWVHPVWDDEHLPPLGLGYLVAFAKAFDGGRLEDHFAFHPRWLARKGHLDINPGRPAIYLFSNYIWNHHRHLELSARIKAENPAAITIHGGPDTPKYAADCEAHLEANPHIDVTVRGEGEATFAALLDALASENGDATEVLDLSTLVDVAGLSVRTPDGVVHTPDRDRIAELDSIPSPLLTGEFDGYTVAPISSLVLETNRGCPYGCTFCDWGSATLSRIRKFDLDRVMAELDWCSANQVGTVALADANFGIFDRDVDIAQRISDLKGANGFPNGLGTNYAKNTVKYLRPIIEILADAEILAEGVVSLQSMDTETLHTIRRRNIRVEKYDALSAEFRRAKLPLAVDIMMGLPGATVDSFRNDLQQCTDREVRVRVHPTILLPNSPMNDPAYRAETGITARAGGLVAETATYSPDDWETMAEIRRAFYAFDHYGLTRHVARHVRRRTGAREIDTYERIFRLAQDEPDEFASISFITRCFQRAMVPPVSWRRFFADLGRLAVQRLDVADDSELATVLTVQEALCPALGRHFPHHVELEHDYGSWHATVVAARESGHRYDWHDHVPRLNSFGPATLTIDDPEGVCDSMIGLAVDRISRTFGSWDLASPVSRPRLATKAGAGG